MDAARGTAGLHVMLVHPEIPPNTGSIARLCAATGVALHLVRPLGFSLEDRYLKRAGLDYWPHVRLHVHESWDDALARVAPRTLVCFSARARLSYVDAPLTSASPTVLVFGSETGGLPPAILAAHPEQTFRIPILTPHVRSLNLSNAVSIVVYETLRQRGLLASAVPAG